MPDTGVVVREERGRSGKGRGEDQGEGGRVPEVRKGRLLHQHGKTPEELHGVGPRRWVKPLTGVEWPKMEMEWYEGLY